jgi:ribokinase
MGSVGNLQDRYSAGMASAGVTIVGSANMDIVFAVNRIPKPGETLIAESAARYPGGKGLNQAVAAARAGARTTFIGSVGSDDNGRALTATMTEAGIITDRLRVTTDPSAAGETGQAFIVVDGSGENTIIVASGANASVDTLTAADVECVRGSAVVLMQLELPMAVVVETAQLSRAAGATVVLNAAPASELPDDLIAALDLLIVNEHEARVISGVHDLDEASAVLAGRVHRLVVTLGSKGSVLFEGGAELARVAAPKVTAVDTTGAGDTFCGALCAALAEGVGFEDSAAFASVAASLSVQNLGAVPSIPSRAAIDGARSA